jgi:hypothetical protein
MEDIKFEGIAFSPEVVSGFESAEAWIAVDGKRFFVGQDSQESKMKAIYDQCCKAAGRTVEKPKPAGRNRRQVESITEETAPIEPEVEGGK